MYNSRPNIIYLKDATNLQELKKLYNRLVLKYHPDKNPGNDTTKIMQSINSEYDYLKTVLHNAEDTKQAQKETEKTMDAFKNLLDVLMKYNNITIELIGSWAWISGYGTFKIKQEVLYDTFHCGYSKGQKKFYWYEGIDNINGHMQKKIKGGYLNKAIAKYGITELKSENKENQYCLA